jgi:hypothetical protein
MTTYWTLYNLPDIGHALHMGLTNHRCGDPARLMQDLHGTGWTAEKLAASDASLARIKLTASGFTVTLFPTLEAAQAAASSLKTEN